MTHLNPIVINATICYVSALIHLIKNQFDYKGAFGKVAEMVKKRFQNLEEWWKIV